MYIILTAFTTFINIITFITLTSLITLTNPITITNPTVIVGCASIANHTSIFTSCLPEGPLLFLCQWYNKRRQDIIYYWCWICHYR
jgi:hypothetical protein